MKCLGGDYEVEEGNGGDRNQYLKDHQIKTYLVVAPDEFHDVSIPEHNCDINKDSILFYDKNVHCFKSLISTHFRCNDKKVQVAVVEMYQFK